jgi:hypothetical protein
VRSALADRRTERAPGVVHVEPRDGATGIFCDTPVALRLSAPVDPRSLTRETLRVQDALGRVPGQAQASADGCLLVWWPARPLRADTLHFVVVSGLRDLHGRSMAPHFSRFVPCGFVRQDLHD